MNEIQQMSKNRVYVFLDQQYFMKRHSFQIGKCSAHSQYYQYVCCNAKCIKEVNLCGLCDSHANQHQTAVYKITDLVNKIKGNISNTDKGIKLSELEHKNLLEVSNSFKQSIKWKEDKVLINLLAQLEGQKQTHDRNQAIVQKYYEQVANISKFKQYFSQLRDKNLLEIKLKTSSSKGLIKFKFRANYIKNNSIINGKLQKKQVSERQLINDLQTKVQNLVSLEISQRSIMKNTIQTNDTSNKSREKPKERSRTLNKI